MNTVKEQLESKALRDGSDKSHNLITEKTSTTLLWILFL